MRMQRVAGILLAGGRSKRMGTDKALLPLPGPIQISFLQHLLQVMLSACDEIILVTRDTQQADAYAHHVQSTTSTNPTSPSIRIVTDNIPDTGPLMGLYSGLRAISTIHTSHAFVCAVDTPLLQPALITFLLDQCHDEANTTTNISIIPVIDNIPQVLLALYPRTILPLIEERLQSGRRDPRSLLASTPTRYIPEQQLRLVDPDLRSFLNVNTPQELKTLHSIIAMDKGNAL